MANEFKIKNGLVVSGSADIENNLTVRGTITADEYHVTLVSSSVLYESGSTKFGDSLDDSHEFTGSLNITGSILLNGTTVGTGKLDETTFNSFTASYVTDSGSFESRIGDLESFSSSLDTSFVSETEFGNYSGSINTFTSSIDGRVDSLETESGSIRSAFNSFTSSYTNVSTSLDSRLDSLETLSGSFTGSFSGSFNGDGTNLFNIPASGVTGLNLTQIADGSVTASVSNTNGLRVNSKSEITGSLIVTNGITGSINYNNLTNVPTLVSGNLQIEITGTTGYSTFSSSISSSIGGLSSSVATTTSNLSSSIGTVSSSISSSIGSLSSSVATTTDNIEDRLGNLEVSTGSLNSFTSSINTTIKSKLDTENVISGSSQVVITDTSGFTEFSSSISSSVTTIFIDNFGQDERLDLLETSSGSLNSFTSSINTTIKDKLNTEGVISGSSQVVISDTVGFTEFSSSISASVTTIFVDNFGQDERLDLLETSSGSLNSFTSSINTTIKDKLNVENVVSGSSQISITGTTGYSTFSSSLATTDLNQENRLNTIEGITGSYATTGSNSFNGNQNITGSLTISQNLTVLGSSSIIYSTASQLIVEDNVIVVNASYPAERFSGLEVHDSGSNGSVTASLLWDGLHNRWIYQNSSDSHYGGAMFIAGPRNTGSLGDETTLTNGRLPKSIGGDHIGDSIVSELSGSIGISGSLVITGSILSTVTPLVSGSDQINHNTTTNYVANQHIDHTTVSISPGSGLTGGGTIAATRTLSIATGGVTNAMLAGSIENGKLSNSSLTIGTTAISLGGTSTTLGGLTSVTSTAFTGSLQGNISGNAATVTTNANLTGVVTSTGNTTTIPNGNITNAMLSNSSFFVGTTSISLGRSSSSQTLNGVSIDGNSANVTGIVAVVNGGTGASTATNARTNLGATTVGGNLFTLTNPSAITFPRINADNTISTLSAADFRSAIGAGTSSTTGTVTSVGGTGTVSGLSLSGTVTTTGNLTLGGTLSVTPSNFSSQTANTFLAAPNGSAGVPTFRTIVAADIPTLNQNTSGNAANVTGTVAVANGGTGATDAATARTNLGLAIGTNVLAQRTFGTAANNNTGDFAAFNAVHFVGTTSIAANRASASQTLTGVSIDGSAGGAGVLNGSGGLTTQYGNGTVGYTFALTNPQTGLFPAVDNSNSILTVNRHPDNYYSQLGFSSNGNLYYRSFSAAAVNTSQAWRTIIDSGNIGSQTVSNVSGTVAVANGGTGATDAATARTNLGLAIGTNVLAQRTFGTAANNNTGDFVLSRGTNWNDSTVIGNTVGMLAWKNYGNGHVIFDASASTAPNGGSISNANPQNNWTGSFPTLMGWNGTNTYGVRVDSARVADGLSSMSVSQFTNDSGYATLSGSNSFSNSYNEFGNGVGSVSNDGGWNGRLNLAGTQHARIDVVSVSDGIITTMFSHTGQNTGRVGTMSNHSLSLMVNGTVRASIDTNGHLLPNSNNAHNLGSASLGWANIFTNDLHLSNMNKPGGNDIDGTNGTWTIQEGAENLYIINNNNGKKFKINLEEII